MAAVGLLPDVSPVGDQGISCSMRQLSARAMAVGGVVVTAALAAVLVVPMTRWLASGPGMVVGVLVMMVPTVAVLVLTGYRWYGWRRSAAVAVIVMALTTVVSWALVAFVLAAALSGSPHGPLSDIALLGAPALTVLVLGLLAVSIASPRANPQYPTERVDEVA